MDDNNELAWVENLDGDEVIELVQIAATLDPTEIDSTTGKGRWTESQRALILAAQDVVGSEDDEDEDEYHEDDDDEELGDSADRTDTDEAAGMESHRHVENIRATENLDAVDPIKY